MKSPSPYGEISIAIAMAPVSQQAKAQSKSAFVDAVRKETSKFEFLLLGDVSVTIEWSVSERSRYETDRSPDVDNILKPLLDSLAGPDGLMIDDNQVQHISCHWIDAYTDDESLGISFQIDIFRDNT